MLIPLTISGTSFNISGRWSVRRLMYLSELSVPFDEKGAYDVMVHYSTIDIYTPWTLLFYLMQPMGIVNRPIVQVSKRYSAMNSKCCFISKQNT